MIYSHSRIECFGECPRKFKHRYIDGIKVFDFDTIERYMGQIVHETLEHLYTRAVAGSPPEIEDLVGHYSMAWNEKIGEHIAVINEGATRDDYMRLGERCIRDYYLRHAPFENLDTVATELMIRADLKNDGNYRLVGFIDRLDRVGDGQYEIHDYKTSSKLLSQNKADVDRQLAIYEMGLRNAYGDVQAVEYVWHYLAYDKQVRSKRDEKTLENQKKDIIESIHRIEEAIVEDRFPQVRTPRCMWCEYKTICANRMHESNNRQATLVEYRP